jgi:polyhydroxyalkanoate synthesis regulator phasin
MAATKRTTEAKRTTATKPQDDDVISRLADKGEEAVRWVVGTPRRMVSDVRGGVDARLHDLVGKLRAVDPLDSRITKLERRLASLENPTKTTSRRTATRARPTTTRRASTAAARPGRAAPDPGTRDDATASNAAEADAPA